MRKTMLCIGGLLLGWTSVAGNDHAALSGIAIDATARMPAIAGGYPLLRVPATEFALRIDARCDEQKHIDAVTVSIADTKQRFAADPPVSAAVFETQLLVKANQIAPIAIEGFCDSDASRGAQPEVRRIDDALRAQLSLRCKDDRTTTIRYASIALNLELRCDRADCDTEQSCIDQDASSSMSRF